MPFHIGLRAVVLATAGVMALFNPVSASTLKIGGTGAATALLGELAPAFKSETGITLVVVPGLGTSGANSAAADGALGVAVSGRLLRDKEKAKGLKEVFTFRTPFGLVTSRPGTENLKRAEVAALYGAIRPLWPDGVPVRITLRPPDESDNALLGEYFPGMAETLQQLRKRSDLSIAVTDQDNAEMAERTKGSLTSASLAQILSEARDLRFVSIDGVAATLDNYRNGTYRLGKSLHLVVPATASPEATAFIAFLGKPAAQALLEKAGVIVGE